MLTEILGLAGSGLAGSVFGIISDMLQARAENKRLETELEIRRRAIEAKQTLDYVSQIGSNNAWYSAAFLILCITYSGCTVLCFLYPDVTIYTLNPDEKPKVLEILWGFIKWERQVNYVYTLSSGGLGFSLLHPVAFMIGSVITGINARSK